MIRLFVGGGVLAVLTVAGWTAAGAWLAVLLVADVAGLAALLAVDRARIRGRDNVESVVLRAVCHEFRAPVSSLGSLTRALSEERTHVPPDVRRRIARLAHDQAVHLDAVLRQAAAVSQGLAGGDGAGRRLPLHRVLPATAGVVPPDRLRAAVSAAAAAREVDAQRIQQVLTNLLENAVRHGPPAGQVRLDARIERRGLVLTVGDDGNATALAAVTAALTRPGPPAGMSGIGLWVVRRLVGAGGGTVRAGHDDDGLVVEVVLPD
jgi:two-component system sensor histidine kinase BaeS/two-component system sensor histidine kinase KdpD